MSIERVGPDIWGNWPLWTVEGEVVRGVRDNSQMLRALHQSVESRLRDTQSELQRNNIEVYNEVHLDIDSAIADLGESMERAIQGSSSAITIEIGRLAQFLGCSLGLLDDKLAIINSQLETFNWSMTRLVDLGEQILDVLYNDLYNTARQHTEQGLRWFYQDELELAKIQLCKSLEYDSTDYLAHYHLGHIGMRHSEFVGAVRSFELATKSARETKDRVRGLSCWARACYKLGQFDSAHEISKQAVELSPEVAVLWFECAAYATYLTEPPFGFDQYVPQWLLRLKQAVQMDEVYLLLAVTHPDFSRDLDIKRIVIGMYRDNVRARREKAEAAEAKARAEREEAEAKARATREELRLAAERETRLASERAEAQARQARAKAERESREVKAMAERENLRQYVSRYLRNLMECIDGDIRMKSLLFRNGRLRQELSDIMQSYFPSLVVEDEIDRADTWRIRLMVVDRSHSGGGSDSALGRLLKDLERFAAHLVSLEYAFKAPPRN